MTCRCRGHEGCAHQPHACPNPGGGHVTERGSPLFCVGCEPRRIAAIPADLARLVAAPVFTNPRPCLEPRHVRTGPAERLGPAGAGPSLTLFSSSLLSRWGFGDGDIPEALLDHWDVLGVAYSEVDWRAALIRLVRGHLLPALAAHHRVDVVEINSHHNPIRAIRIDGVDVSVFWDQIEGGPVLTPESVQVGYAVIAAACGV